ncbi:WD40 repeat-like protein [Macrolepiota fuliginosa MF-IS2]|uniref:WD40 repeat-like protein n=1 Tax=Macrolepiota fuliginosa MF-IS2 TaxID=1400762 RepID=A0A9P5X907_9AGAR|nr:WD40 repeat-like protein [Macrolepiota fuliginosa MF-IS2]
MENETTFVAPEGVYSLTEEHKPALAQSHTTPILFPTKVSSVAIRVPPAKPQGSGPPGLAQLLGGNKDAKKDKDKDKSATGSKEDGYSLSSSDTPDEIDQLSPIQESSNTASPLPEQQSIFSPTGGRGKRGARPKHNIKTTSSTFVTRIQTSDNWTKTLQSKQGDLTLLCYNVAKSFLLVEAGSKAKEPLARILFSAYPTCHDINQLTSSCEHLDVIIGFNTGDLVWLDPITSRYARLNKQGCISNSPCTAIRWVPSSPTLFLVSHADGTIVVYDKERDDGTFSPQEPTNGPPSLDITGTPISEEAAAPIQRDWDPTDNIFVTMPPWHPVTTGAGAGINVAGKSDKDSKVVKNPVSHWRISRKGVVDFVFSPDVKYVAAISEDGCLRVIDALAEQLVDCYASYFGALTCVAWSPDGRFILTGGQDDLITIFSPWEQRVVARCQGHSSFVAGVAFDDLRCDGRTYRFGSVGEDNKLILWDFSSGALHRPKYQATHHQRMSMSSTISLAFRRDKSASYLPAGLPPGLKNTHSLRHHPAPSRNEIAIVQPVLIKSVDCDLLTDIAFLPRSLLTATKSGHIRLWVRPLNLRKPTRNSSLLPDVQNLIS